MPAHPKLTQERQDRIVRAIRAGVHISEAAAAAGISRRTYYKWLQRGQEARSGRYHAFAEAVERAEAECEVEAVARWRQQGRDDWRAQAEFLARRFPERWSPSRRVEVTGEGGGPVTIAAVPLTDEVVDAADDLLIALDAADQQRELPAGEPASA